MLAQIDQRRVSIFPYCRDESSTILLQDRLNLDDVDSHLFDKSQDLSSSTIHDLRNILTVLNSGAHLLRKAATQERQEMLLAAIEQAAATAAQLTSALTNPMARTRPNVERVDLAARLPRLALLCRVALPADIDLVLELAPDLRLVETSAAELETAILNLILNAGEAMPTGGRLTVRAHNREPNRVSVLVADCGHGMTPATRARIGNSRFTTKSGSGHGLGLVQVARFARAVGARFALRSTMGRGTVIRLDLPAVLRRRTEGSKIHSLGGRS